MATLDMYGPFNLTISTIDEKVTKTSPGNYALGKVNEKGVFIVLYVGRSDSNINDRIKDWVGSSKYKKFKFSYASSAKAAFEKECKNYHDFGGKAKLDNDVHPKRPDGSSYSCPNCTIYD